MKNIRISKRELQMIRELDDFDLTMLLSQINDTGWVHPAGPNVGAKGLLPMIWEARLAEEKRKNQ
jgi:hypothetical protein